MQKLKNLFNSDKKYYLELGDEKDSEVVQNVVQATTEVTDTVKEKAAEVAKSQPVKEAVEKATEVAESVQEQVASATTDEKPAKAKAKAKSKQNGKAPKTTTVEAQETKATPAKNSGASSFEPPFWVAAMYKNNGSTSNGKAAEQTFATDNLMPTVTNYRRRPGGSLAKFKDMARKARTPGG
jgi:outer membrane biosynthesis protein TonB